MPLLDTIFLQNSVRLWLIALVITAVFLGLFYAIEMGIVRRLRKRAKETDSSLDDLALGILDSTQFLLVLTVSLYAGSTILTFENRAIDVWLRTIAIISALVQAGIWGHRFLFYFINRSVRSRSSDERTVDSTVNALTLVSRILLWSVVSVLILDNIPNVEVTSLIAGLGIAGIAVGLAVQNILGDLLASLSIILDRPFVVGDFVTVGEHSGTIKRVGLKSTRVRSLQGEELVFSNSDMLNSRIQNYGKMRIRRVDFLVRVVYDTPPDKLRQIPDMLREVIEGQEEVRFDRAHFANLGDFSLEYEIVYFVLTQDYAIYRDKQQAINLGIMQRFADAGIDFAYPTQIVHVAGHMDNPTLNRIEPLTE